MLGICDDQQRLCFALALWNARDPILKERLFGLTGREGNHGEDVKEYYFYLDSTPTHSYMKGLYKYPQRAFPYDELVAENRAARPGRAGVRAARHRHLRRGPLLRRRRRVRQGRPDDILIRITVDQPGPGPAPLHLLPTLWFRNTWAWGCDRGRARRAEPGAAGRHRPWRPARAGRAPRRSADYWLVCRGQPRAAVHRERDQRRAALGRDQSYALRQGRDQRLRRCTASAEAVNPSEIGTKAAAHYRSRRRRRRPRQIRLRLAAGAGERRRRRPLRATSTRSSPTASPRPTRSTQRTRARRLTDDEARVQRQALRRAALDQAVLPLRRRAVARGDPASRRRPPSRKHGRNSQWRHLNSADVISMPDKWEYPWYAAWDLAFHCIAVALVDPDFAKEQLLLLLREWYMHPNGQMPAYEWAFGDVNPPVHAWAAWRVYKIEQRRTGDGDREFLERIFHKLLLNFTWWVNRKDAEGNNVFQGGFLGLDNIGVVRPQRAAADGRVPRAGRRHRLDGHVLPQHAAIALELARARPGLRGHRHQVLRALPLHRARHEQYRRRGSQLWDEEDGFFYDVLQLPDGSQMPLKVRSLVGLIPLFAAITIDREYAATFARARRRLRRLACAGSSTSSGAGQPGPGLARAGDGDAAARALVPGDRLHRVLTDARRERVPHRYGVRSLCRATISTQPYVLRPRRAGVSASTTSRPSRPPACSAATRTGAGRSGSRSTTC